MSNLVTLATDRALQTLLRPKPNSIFGVNKTKESPNNFMDIAFTLLATTATKSNAKCFKKTCPYHFYVMPD